MRPQHPERRVDSDGVTHVAPARSSGVGLWLVGGALVFTAVCIGLSVWLSSADVEVEAPPLVETPPAPVVQPPVVVARAPVQKPRPSAPVATPVVEEPAAVPPPEPEQPYTGPTGTQLYRPGTKPLKRGIVVPDDFELPPGYVRHYQSTDDGERLKAILMFHPDYQPKDDRGEPIPLPENRVVPAEMAPPGLPIQMLDLPESSEAGAAQ